MLTVDLGGDKPQVKIKHLKNIALNKILFVCNFFISDQYRNMIAARNIPKSKIMVGVVLEVEPISLPKIYHINLNRFLYLTIKVVSKRLSANSEA